MSKRTTVNSCKTKRAGFIGIMLAFAIAISAFTAVGFKSANAAYSSVYGSKTEAIHAGAALNERIAQEGMVLLKNEDGFLPMSTSKGTGSSRVSLFGAKSTHPSGGGSASEGEPSMGQTRVSTDIYQSLKDANFIINPVTETMFRYWGSPTNQGGRNLTSDWAQRDVFKAAKAELKESYATYNDAAIVVLAGTSSPSEHEGRRLTNADAYPNGGMGEGYGQDTEIAHSRQLDKPQFDLLDEVCENFDNVVIIINDSRPLELGFLEDGSYPQIKAALLVGEPGTNGFVAVGQLLSGQVNPSGRLVDMYVNGFQNNPSWMNFGQNFRNKGGWYTDMEGVVRNYGSEAGGSYGSREATAYMDYEEGIYMGYRYYETRGYTEKQANSGSTWYEDNVVYPFGYGLSYTDFDWEVLSSAPAAGSAITDASEISIRVKVTNTGTKAGKDVVELFYTSPYKPNGIEKSHVVLGDFAKTKLLQPGEYETVTLRISAYDMASYDWNDKNENSFKGYELEDGAYKLNLMKNSHEVVETVSYTVTTGIKCQNSKSTGYEVKNQFEDVNSVITSSSRTVLSRNNWIATYPTTPTIEDMKISDADFAKWDVAEGAPVTAPWLPASYDAGAPWERTTAPTFANAATRPAVAAVKLAELTGKGFDDPLWDTLLNELTLDEAINLINTGGFNTAAIPYIGKPSSFDTDGPQGWTGSGVGGTSFNRFALEAVVASTWSKEIAYEQGKMIGEQGIWGNADAATGVKTYTGWYAPAMNLHRNPYETRYNEYYSEDAFLTGIMAANTSLGVKSKGGYVYIKHFALHENGDPSVRGAISTDTIAARSSGLSIWCDEQAMRELYFRAFQISVEIGKASAAMTSFSRIGSVWAGGSYALLTELLRNEWGFRGLVITDIELYTMCHSQQMIRAGGDLVLSSRSTITSRVQNNATVNTPTQLWAVRNAAKNILYTVANSNAMQTPLGAAIRYVAKALPNGTIGAAYSNTVAATGTTGTAAQGFYWNTAYTGYAVRSYAVTSGTLPTGLSLDASTGDITGTPTASGAFAFAITCSATGFASASATFTVNIAALQLSAPADAAVSNGTLSWTAVANASGYIVEDNGIQYIVNGGSITSYSLSALAVGAHTLKVKAVGDKTAYEDSSWSAEVNHTVTAADLPKGENGNDGADGIDGNNGLTPRIGENGNWWIGDTDTGVKAQGPSGEKGSAGCANSSASIIAMLSLLACAFVVVIKKQF